MRLPPSPTADRSPEALATAPSREAGAPPPPTQPPLPMPMPRVAPDQLFKFQRDELFARFSHDSEMHYVGARNQPPEQRREHFLRDLLQEGWLNIAFRTMGFNLRIFIEPRHRHVDLLDPRIPVLLRSRMILDGVCVIFTGQIDRHSLVGVGHIEFDAESAAAESERSELGRTMPSSSLMPTPTQTPTQTEPSFGMAAAASAIGPHGLSFPLAFPPAPPHAPEGAAAGAAADTPIAELSAPPFLLPLLPFSLTLPVARLPPSSRPTQLLTPVAASSVERTQGPEADSDMGPALEEETGDPPASGDGASRGTAQGRHYGD